MFPSSARQTLHQPSPNFFVLLVLAKTAGKISMFDFRVLIIRALHSAIIPISPNGPLVDEMLSPRCWHLCSKYLAYFTCGVW
jgi:hypothetical protein